MLDILPETTPGVLPLSIQVGVLKRVTPKNGAIHRVDLCPPQVSEVASARARFLYFYSIF